MPRCAPDTKELPEEPESGSSSSSTTEPVEVTNTHNSKAFIGTALKHIRFRQRHRGGQEGSGRRRSGTCSTRSGARGKGPATRRGPAQ